MRRRYKESGFTLVELVVIIGLFAILGLIFTATLMQTLRGQNKSRVLNQVKQNGQVVLDRLSNEIHQAEKIVCVGKNSANTGSFFDDTLVVYKGGTYTRFRFFPPVGDTANGYIAREDFTSEDVLADLNRQDDIFDDPILCIQDLKYSVEGFVKITDQDPVRGVSIKYFDNNSPVFSRSKMAGFADVITVKFMIASAVSAGVTYENLVDGIPFSTAVQIKGEK